MARLPETASQTAGPYVHIGCVPNFSEISGVYDQDIGAEMVSEHTKGTRISIVGSVFDGAGDPLNDALIEIWQADAQGCLGPHDPRGAGDPHFKNFGRQPADLATGAWRFETIMPGVVSLSDNAKNAPHITFWIVARGINIGLHTRMYFPNDPRNDTDPILALITPRDRVATLIASQEASETYRFNIHLQGPQETVFFDV